MDPPRCKGSRTLSDPRLWAIPDIHGHAKGEHRPFAEERPIAYSPRMLFLWFYHACRRSSPRFLMVTDHINYLTFEDPGAVHTVRRALKLAHAGDLYGAAETAGVDVAHAAVVSEGLRKGMRFSIGAEVDNDPRSRPDAQNIVDAMRPDGIIRSVHFLSIDHPEKGADFQWPYDNVEFAHLWDHVGVERAWELYVERLVDDVEKLPGHVVGHFYKPALFGHWPDDAKLQQYEDRILDAAAARGMAIEINARPLYRDFPDEHRQKYIDVNKRFMRKAKAKNVGIAIGSDAHSPKDQGGGFETVLQMLDDCDINEVVFPVNGRLARVVLRATKEHIEAQQRGPEPVQAGSSISGLGRAELGLPEEPDRPEKSRETTSKSGRDAGPKKRASSPARTTKKPATEEPGATSKRSPESAASSAKAKDTKSAAKTAAPKKAAVEKKPAETKPVEKKPAEKKAVEKKAPPEKKALEKKLTPAKKATASAKKATPVKKALPSAKKAAPVKKAPPKKPAAAVAKKAPSKKAAPKKPATKPAAKPVAKKAAKPASKPAAKKAPAKKSSAVRPVKKTSKPSSKGTTKKKTTKKR